jgi:photosystem II stability/assembly factor-like uncharacterized protein
VITTDTRPAGRIGGGDLPMPIAHPKNPDIVIMASTVSWKSIDGGKTWAAFKGAPGGEDYQYGWINPDNPDIMLFAADQGAVVTLNDGDSWSSWYNQPTGQFYHVSADNAFPYRVCSGQQENGSVCVSSRGNYGAISDRDWLPVGVDEYGFVAPDPLNPDIVYGGRNVTRFDRRTGQVSVVGPVGGRGGVGAAPGTFRQVRTMPVIFSEVDKRTLFFGNNHLWKTLDGGMHWKQISPDLTRPTWKTPASVGKYADQPTAQSSPRGVIYTVAPSYQDINRIWVGTDDGLIHVTADGGLTWKDVTPPAVEPWAKVSVMDAGRFSPLTAYTAINTLRLDDLRPHILRTHDGGKTWTEIVNGIPNGETVNAVREDPKRKGLLFAGSERAVYVSFDDGANWQSLRQNMAVSSVRDLIVKDDDLIAATHGRGFWILDDITPLRQIDPRSADEDVLLFKPTPAWRVRWNTSVDMPWPKEEPTGPNPPEGTPINYYLKAAASGPIVLEIRQQDGRLVRRYSSSDPVAPIPEPAAAPAPVYWYRAPQALSTSAGMHRFHWDVHYQPLTGLGIGEPPIGVVPTQLPIQAIPYNTVPAPSTPWVNPGTYTVSLTVNGKSYTQPLVVKQDPRVKTPALSLQQVYALTKSLYYGAVDARVAATRIGAARQQLAKMQASGPAASAAARFMEKASALEGTPPAVGGGRGRGGGAPVSAGPADTLWAVSSSLAALMNSMQAADVAPTANTLNAITAAHQNAARVMARWQTLRTIDLPAVNAQLKAAGLEPIALDR